MKLDAITPVVITLDEEPNIGRLLARLSWASRVIVLDSGSTDSTASIVAGVPNAEFHYRRFDSLSEQWNAAVALANTEWVLALDADHLPSDSLESELRQLSPPAETAAYRGAFVYSIFGRPLRASLYPSLPLFFRRSASAFYQDGHSNKLRVTGAVSELRSRFFHDDRKPLDRWVRNQQSYMKNERAKLQSGTEPLDFVDRLRKSHLFAPVLAFVYVLFVKRAIFDGKAGLYYAYQRMVAEAMLALELLDEDLRRNPRD